MHSKGWEKRIKAYCRKNYSSAKKDTRNFRKLQLRERRSKPPQRYSSQKDACSTTIRFDFLWLNAAMRKAICRLRPSKLLSWTHRSLSRVLPPPEVPFPMEISLDELLLPEEAYDEDAPTRGGFYRLYAMSVGGPRGGEQPWNTRKCDIIRMSEVALWRKLWNHEFGSSGFPTLKSVRHGFCGHWVLWNLE